jgi:hypothetical protein
VPTVQTTTPDSGDTGNAAGQVPSWALVLLWSAEEPHRVGEVAFLPAFERRLVGRGDEEVEKFAHFGKQRPDEPLAPSSRDGLLAGDGISRRQLLLHATTVPDGCPLASSTPPTTNGSVAAWVPTTRRASHGLAAGSIRMHLRLHADGPHRQRRAEDLNAERRRALTGNEAERRHHEDSHQHIERLRRPLRQVLDGEDARQVDRHGDEKQPAQRGRRPNFCDEEIRPLGRKGRHGSVPPDERLNGLEEQVRPLLVDHVTTGQDHPLGSLDAGDKLVRELRRRAEVLVAPDD